MSNSAITTQLAQLKVGNVQNQADSSSVYSAGVWSFKNSTAVTNFSITDTGAFTLGPSNSNSLDSTIFAKQVTQSSNSPFGTRYIFTSTSTNGRTWQIGSNFSTGTGEFAIYDASANAERMRIDASGNVTVSTGDFLVSGSTKLIGSLGSYNTTTGSAANVHILSNGYMLRSTSALKYKEDITPISHGLQTVLSMQPIEYKSKCEVDKDAAHKFIGFVADWEEANLPALVQKNGEGEVEGFSYDRLTAVLCKAIQELSAKVEEQSSRIDAQAEEIKALKAQP